MVGIVRAGGMGGTWRRASWQNTSTVPPRPWVDIDFKQLRKNQKWLLSNQAFGFQGK